MTLNRYQISVILGLPSVILIGTVIAFGPRYRVYSARMAGEAEYAQAEQNRQIVVSQARAERDAEILKAEGTAKANKIIGDSLKNNADYLRWMWLSKLEKNDQRTVIYVPTDGMIPQLETGRASMSGAAQ